MALPSQDFDASKSCACACACVCANSCSYFSSSPSPDDISSSCPTSSSSCSLLLQFTASKTEIQEDQRHPPFSPPCRYLSSHPPHRCGEGAHGSEHSFTPDIFSIPVLLRRKWLLFVLAVAANTYILVLYSHSFTSTRADQTTTTTHLISFLDSLYLILVNMVANIGGLAARAVFLMSTRPLAQRADAATYTSNAVDAIRTLQTSWYDVGTGLWDNAWWNSANAFTTLADFADLNRDAANELNLGGVLKNTFDQAQKATATAAKSISALGLVTTSYAITKRENPLPLEARQFSAQGFPNFINEYYDDEGWWALGLIRAYDITRDQDYLDMAVRIFADMKTGGNTTCDGGIYWSKDRKYVNAIANELYLSVAASLANRITSDKASYLSIATSQWAWFKASGMINDEGTINDGLDGDCQNNGANVWSYNQGVVLGALVELSRATGDKSVLTDAANIAKAAIKRLADDNGILHDTCEPNCGSDGNQFKGIFVRNLRYLHAVAPQNDFKTFLLKNADSNWSKNRDAKGKLGVVWSGPVQGVSGPTHSSALDSIVAAIAVA
ncbi:Putative glycoside hydrolase, family 76, six-hairpin glycosidase superfamily [Colletotrichum destructivum]|uniref:Glycoside hydrolase, family 76, six-hairpin glycosidase superfamily n=1 Tax=Colletotrichum destructivum TaxID=34406 RepID=A0AAX4IAD3_9PEZI|nr:Putative glycoside hydrolase, family 76, six-hairpin glycosidase superfamily [Colletotrichum destructivum]